MKLRLLALLAALQLGSPQETPGQSGPALRILSVGDSITMGGGAYSPNSKSPADREEAAALLEALTGDASAQSVPVLRLRAHLEEHVADGVEIENADRNHDGLIDFEEMADVVIPALMGAPQVGDPSYRPALWELLRDRGTRAEFVGSACGGARHGCRLDVIEPWERHEANWGISARTMCRGSHNLLSLDERIRRAQYVYDVVLLHIGTNDLSEQRSIEETVSYIQCLVDVVKRHQPGAQVFVAEIVRTRFVPDHTVEGLNLALRSAFEGVDDVSTVAMGGSLFEVARHTCDGVHPNADGADIMAQQWFQALCSAQRRGAPLC